MLKAVGVVDADAHAIETEATWDYMTAEESQYCKPMTLDPGRPTARGDPRPHRYWVVDGRAARRLWRTDENTGTTVGTRELIDVQARVRHMDEMGVDVQVVYPTYLLHAPSPRPEVELALYRSYNRWLADRTSEANGRLRWVVMPPLRSMDKAVDELRWGKDHGAVGVFKRAIECDGRSVADPYFFPLYEEAMRLDLAICMHTGREDFSIAPPAENFGGSVVPNIACFNALFQRKVPDRFPTLRFGVIEAMASWVPYVIAQLKARSLRDDERLPVKEEIFNFQTDFFRANRFYVACQTSDDIPWVLKYGTENALMIGTDYGHTDPSAVMDALNFVERLGEDGEISMAASKKTLIDNPRAFYGL